MATEDPSISPEVSNPLTSGDAEKARDEGPHVLENTEVLRQSWSRKDLIIAFSG